MAQNVWKTVVCLANSRKLSGRCIAGRELNEGQPDKWIRPVSSREAEEVSEYERQYQDGSDPKVLDIMEIPLLSPHPKDHQTENWLLDPEYYWVKRDDPFAWKDLDILTDPVDNLWHLGSNTIKGQNDKISETTANQLQSSLRFIALPKLSLSVFSPGEAFGDKKRRVQAQFTYNGQPYKLWVTDPVYERRYLQSEDGDYEIDRKCYVTISIGAFKENCYKLVAAIIEKPEC